LINEFSTRTTRTRTKQLARPALHGSGANDGTNVAIHAPFCRGHDIILSLAFVGRHGTNHLPITADNIETSANNVSSNQGNEECGHDEDHITPIKKHLLVRLLLKLTKKEEREEKKKEQVTLDMMQPSRYKPNDLEQMAEETKFSKSK
jgi:hypothetical protein